MQGYCKKYQCPCEFAKDNQYKNGCELDNGNGCDSESVDKLFLIGDEYPT
jgi:hypothetical protein